MAILPIHHGRSVPCPHCGTHFAPRPGVATPDAGSEPSAADGSALETELPCPSCHGPVLLGPQHLGQDVHCPHCGHGFRPSHDAIVPAPRAPGRFAETRPPGRRDPSTVAFTLSLVGMVCAMTTCLCCAALPGALCAPIGLTLALQARAAALREHRPLHEHGKPALILGIIGTIVLVVYITVALAHLLARGRFL